MNSSKRKNLLQRRAQIESKLTRMQTFLESLGDNQLSNVHEIKLRYEDLGVLMSLFDDVQSELELGDNGNGQAHEEARSRFETKYYKVRGDMGNLIANTEESSLHSGSSGRSSAGSVSRLKLPPINIPKFDGRYENWLSFADGFKVMIHNNDQLPTIQKFHYLASVVTGPASQLIQNLPITEANYGIAWKMLEDRFQNKKLIATTHVKELLSLKPVASETAKELLRYSSTFNSNLNALKALELTVPLHEVILTHVFARGLDSCTRRDWELSQTGTQPPSLDDLLSFVEHKRQALENVPSAQLNKSVPRPSFDRAQVRSQEDAQARYSYVTTSPNKCSFCQDSHTILKCGTFAALSLEEKLNIVKERDLCYNCLRSEHFSRDCKSRGCKLCNRKHHTSLHKHNENAFSDEETGSTRNQTMSHSAHTHSHEGDKHSAKVMLSTALVKVMDSDGKFHVCRALLDSGSQTNLCTESLVQRLRLRRYKNPIPISGINNSLSQTKYGVHLQLQSTVSEFRIEMSCSIFPCITGTLPRNFIQHDHWNLPTDITLADPNFFQPGDIELLIGAEYFFSLMKPNRRTRSPDFPVLQDSELGWILAGRFLPQEEQSSAVTTCFLRTEDRLESQLQRFWEIEDLSTPVKTTEEVACEQHFMDNTTRDESGRYMVRLPLKQEPVVLGNSFGQAMSRLVQLERRLSKQPSLKQDYHNFLREYELLGHMVKVNNSAQLGDARGSYYLPHHPVFKQSSSTTKTRVVFDASAKSSNDLSLNDILMTGPTIQEDLYSIILRFRTYTYAFIADIAQMFRQVKMHADDRKLQQIIWREHPKQEPSCYELTTITYGTAAAPFLATRCLQQLAEDEKSHFPRAAQILRRDFYVDDLLSGCNDLQGAVQLQSELITLLSKGGFPLRKWCANHPALLEYIPEQNRELKLPLNLNQTNNVKSLGLLWQPITDMLLICSSVKDSPVDGNDAVVTKRRILSEVASIFDPLGLVGPIVISYKVFLQQLWLLRLNWDDEIPSHLCKEWKKMYLQLPTVREIHVNRLVTCPGGAADIQMHGFSDASEHAYGACLYLRSVDKMGRVVVNLLCSRSRVAPVKRLTLPRLELCGALLLAELLRKSLSALSLSFNKILLWTDSTIVLSWLRSPSTRWKTFVANRVSSIQEYTSNAEWRHVPSGDNPADLISRGVSPGELRTKELWWNGPRWLVETSASWPSANPSPDGGILPETRVTPAVVLTVSKELSQLLQRYSSLARLKRVTAYCLRFIHNCSNPNNKVTGTLSVEELRAAFNACIKIAQQEYYAEEIACLSLGTQVPRKSKIADLHPFLDANGMLRVGGRLNNATLPYCAKHQLILPPHHCFTNLVVMAEHLRLLHANAQLLIASLRQELWIPTARAVVRKIIHKCLTCFRFKASTSEQLMGQLPAMRVQQCRPFLNAGVDYAGPYAIKKGIQRSKTTTKSYIAIFICLATRAIHLEVVSDLTTDAFLAAFRRFTARRGICSNIYSDNGTTFVGAYKKLKELRALFKSKSFTSEVTNVLAMDGITWHFIPPSSPHFGGLWEAAVKSMKHHLRRIAGNASLTFEELCTLTTQIEACLNSRPLSVLSDDPNDPSFISPAHFLIGAPLTSIPEPDITDLPMNRLSRWQRIQSMQQQLWKRWSSDYLNSLQQRRKWTSCRKNLVPGTVVLLKEDNLPPVSWKLAVVHETHPGKDGLVRVATVKTSGGYFKRPITKLIGLPIATEC